MSTEYSVLLPFSVYSVTKAVRRRGVEVSLSACKIHSGASSLVRYTQGLLSYILKLRFSLRLTCVSNLFND